MIASAKIDRLNKIIGELYNPDLSMPVVEYSQDTFFPDYIKIKLHSYSNIVKGCDFFENDEDIFISELCSNLIESINVYFEGNIFKAYEKAKMGFNRCKSILPHTRPIYNVYLQPIKSYYRARETEDYFNDIKKPEDLFHRPFEQRYLLEPFRYSISGIPCLYLGESVYVSWLELGSPDINKLAFTRFVTGVDSFKLIDLSWKPQQYGYHLNQYKREIIEKNRIDEE